MDIKRILASAPRKHERGEAAVLTTPWGESIDPARVRAEHPHPQFAREAFRPLNGWWQYAIVPTLNAGESWSRVRPPTRYDGRILVPFSPEAPLSGVRRTVLPTELLWYRRAFATPGLGEGDRCLLHFEAVDYACACYVNGERVGVHEGGYLPFAFDVTDLLRERPDHVPAHGLIEENELTLCVWDPSDAGTQPRGKQRLEPGGIWYAAQSGIWQPVWLEVVPACRVESMALRPDPTAGVLGLEVRVHGAGKLLHVDVTAPDGALAVRETVRVEDDSAVLEVRVPVSDLRLWSPDDPCLYGVTLRYGHDVVHSYAAFRTVEVARADDGAFRFMLNGEPLFLRGVLDQGYWPDGLMTAPSDEALAFDVQAMRDAGFNLLRKHLKVEADRWYYHCDRLGMLVWQDMVSGGGPPGAWATSYKPTLLRWSWDAYADDVPSHRERLSAGDEGYRARWRAQCHETVAYLADHPSVVAWVLFNEGWGQFDAAAAAAEVRALDPTRPVDAVSGWYDQHCGDFLSVHNYFRKLEVYPDDPSRLVGAAAMRGGRAFVVSEFGGLALGVPGHTAYRERYGYDSYEDVPSWAAALAAALAEADALEAAGAAGWVYTQLSDVEEEVNGLLTYDRRVSKLALAAEGAARPGAVAAAAGEGTCPAARSGGDQARSGGDRGAASVGSVGRGRGGDRGAASVGSVGHGRGAAAAPSGPQPEAAPHVGSSSAGPVVHSARAAGAWASAGTAELRGRAAARLRSVRETVESLRAPEVRVPRGKEQRP